MTQKATIYALCMRENYKLRTLHDRELQFTHFVWHKK